MPSVHSPANRSLSVQDQRQRNGDTGPFARHAAQVQRTSVEFRHSLRDDQPQTYAGMLTRDSAIELLECHEQILNLPFRDADAFVPYLHAKEFVFALAPLCNGQAELASIRRELDGVTQKAHQSLL